MFLHKGTGGDRGGISSRLGSHHPQQTVHVRSWICCAKVYNLVSKSEFLVFPSPAITFESQASCVTCIIPTPGSRSQMSTGWGPLMDALFAVGVAWVVCEAPRYPAQWRGTNETPGRCSRRVAGFGPIMALFYRAFAGILHPNGVSSVRKALLNGATGQLILQKPRDASSRFRGPLLGSWMHLSRITT